MPNVIDSYASANAYLGKKDNRPAPKGNAMRIVGDLIPGAIAVVYHKTPIVTYYEDGRVTLWANGWATRTTAAHMAEYLPSAWGYYFTPKTTRDAGEKKGRGEIVLHGVRLGSQDRSGRGNAFLVTRRAKNGETYDHNVLDFFREDDMVTFAPSGQYIGSMRGRFPTYDCKCKMCATGASSWQQTAY